MKKLDIITDYLLDKLMKGLIEIMGVREVLQHGFLLNF